MSWSLKEVTDNFGPPDGTYRMRFDDVSYGLSGTGNHKLQLTARIINGELSGRKYVYSRSLQAAAIWKLKEDLIAAGIDEEDPLTNPFDNPKQFANDVRAILCSGKVFDISAKTTVQTKGEYKGKKQTEYTILGDDSAVGEYEDDPSARFESV